MISIKGSFLIKSKEENVITEKGVRAFIMEKMMNYPFSRGSVLNIDGKTVQASLEGDEKQIKAFMQDLRKALSGQFGNPEISITEFRENTSLEIPQLMRSSQALMVGQLQKGINVQLEILSTLKNTQNSLKSLPSEIARVIKEK